MGAAVTAAAAAAAGRGRGQEEGLEGVLLAGGTPAGPAPEPAGAAAAAAREREQEQVLECFRLADATAAGRAQTLERLGLVGDVTVERLFKAGVVLPGS